MDILGRHILYLAPDVSVSRVDAIRLGDLQEITAGSFERRKVVEIKSKIIGEDQVEKAAE
jgi:hypothetical protein